MSNPFTKPVRNRSNARQRLTNLLATLLAKKLQLPEKKLSYKGRRSASDSVAGLYGRDGGRKYLNVAERRRFYDSALTMPDQIRTFCLLLMWSGCRISEALAVNATAIDIQAGTLSLETLKKRTRGVVRQVPLPAILLSELERVFDIVARQRDPTRAAHRLWTSSRSTAWRQVKTVMQRANIVGRAAMPKGLRHTFGVAAFQAVPPHLVQRWLGHASLRSTAIYGDVSGIEERSFAERIWGQW